MYVHMHASARVSQKCDSTCQPRPRRCPPVQPCMPRAPRGQSRPPSDSRKRRYAETEPAQSNQKSVQRRKGTKWRDVRSWSASPPTCFNREATRTAPPLTTPCSASVMGHAQLLTCGREAVVIFRQSNACLEGHGIVDPNVCSRRSRHISPNLWGPFLLSSPSYVLFRDL